MKKIINAKMIEIQNRFFDALYYGIETRRINGGLKGFCDAHGLNRTKYCNIKNEMSIPIEERKETNYKAIDLDALAYVCEDCHVSPEWLLLGRGKMLL